MTLQFSEISGNLHFSRGTAIYSRYLKEVSISTSYSFLNNELQSKFLKLLSAGRRPADT